MNRVRGLCLFEVLTATSLLAFSSLALFELHLWSQREVRAERQKAEIREAMLNRLALARLERDHQVVPFIPQHLDGVTFSKTEQEVVSHLGHKGNKITLTASWIDPHNISHNLTFNALIAF